METQSIPQHFAPVLSVIGGIAAAYLFFAGGHNLLAALAFSSGILTALAMRD